MKQIFKKNVFISNKQLNRKTTEIKQLLKQCNGFIFQTESKNSKIIQKTNRVSRGYICKIFMTILELVQRSKRTFTFHSKHIHKSKKLLKFFDFGLGFGFYKYTGSKYKFYITTKNKK